RHYLRVRPDAVTHAPLEEELRQGASALAKNDLAAAARHFSALAAREPRHPEVLLGLAGLAMRQGNLPEARARYQAALTARPHDARAEAGMVALMAETGEGEPEIWESRLRQIIAKQPDSASPYFVLGNLLAGQKRWREAELAYFEASRLEANNPDYRFNLAVSLDALRQKKQAAEHYRAALLAAETLPAAFDPAVAKNRLLLLEAEEDAP
ncbi:MAG: tetratricopeptide repeat protein, partial [Zoogloeaceae bacterium]|nr:tetratricopeptide repeat protein [Zoogloeaceae bacterium]